MCTCVYETRTHEKSTQWEVCRTLFTQRSVGTGGTRCSHILSKLFDLCQVLRYRRVRPPLMSISVGRPFYCVGVDIMELPHTVIS